MFAELMARVRSLWRGVVRTRLVDAELNEEFRLHIELRAADLVRAGMTPAEAARKARAEFGSPEYHVEKARNARGLAWFDEMRFSWLDLKLGRAMRTTRLFVFIGVNLCALTAHAQQDRAISVPPAITASHEQEAAA